MLPCANRKCCPCRAEPCGYRSITRLRRHYLDLDWVLAIPITYVPCGACVAARLRRPTAEALNATDQCNRSSIEWSIGGAAQTCFCSVALAMRYENEEEGGSLRGTRVRILLVVVGFSLSALTWFAAGLNRTRPLDYWRSGGMRYLQINLGQKSCELYVWSPRGSGEKV